jgi:hypothetical protein
MARVSFMTNLLGVAVFSKLAASLQCGSGHNSPFIIFVFMFSYTRFCSPPLTTAHNQLHRPTISLSLWSLWSTDGTPQRVRHATGKKLGQELLDNCRGVAGQPPLYKHSEDFLSDPHTHFPYAFLVTFPTVPRTEILRSVISSTLESTGRTYANSRHMSRRSPVLTKFLVQSTF